MACSSTFMWLLELFSSFNGHEFNCTHLAACAVNRRQSLGNYVVITQRMQGSQHHSHKEVWVRARMPAFSSCLCYDGVHFVLNSLSLSPSLLLYLTLYLIYLSLSLSLHLTHFIMYLTLTLLSLSLSLNLTFSFKSNVLLFYFESYFTSCPLSFTHNIASWIFKWCKLRKEENTIC